MLANVAAHAQNASPAPSDPNHSGNAASGDSLIAPLPQPRGCLPPDLSATYRLYFRLLRPQVLRHRQANGLYCSREEAASDAKLLMAVEPGIVADVKEIDGGHLVVEYNIPDWTFYQEFNSDDEAQQNASRLQNEFPGLETTIVSSGTTPEPGPVIFE